MKRFLGLVAMLCLIVFFVACQKAQSGFRGTVKKEVALAAPKTLTIALDEVMKKRRTIRSFDTSKKLSLQEVSTILFAMQGKTSGKKRTVPSPYAAYPLQIYIVANNIDGLEDGMYKMDIANFKLQMYRKGDYRSELAKACGGQSVVKKSQLRIIITCLWEQLTRKMGQDARKWGMFEAGSASQNGFLAATAMGLHTVPVGGMKPELVAKVIDVEHAKETPLIVNCFGR